MARPALQKRCSGCRGDPPRGGDQLGGYWEVMEPGLRQELWGSKGKDRLQVCEAGKPNRLGPPTLNGRVAGRQGFQMP